MAKFTHLHVHSHYSLLDGLPKINLLIDHVKKLGMDSVALTDHGNLYGAIEFYKAAKAQGIKPIIGCEVYLALERMDQKRPNVDNKSYHFVLLAKNQEGYKNLVKLVTKANLEGFYYKPRIDKELLAKHSAGLIGLTACVQGKIPKLILSGKIDEAKKEALEFQKIFGPDNFYLEIQNHPNIPEQDKVNKALISFSKELNIPLVATCDAHYLNSDDAEAQDILMLINTGADINNPQRLTMINEDFSVKSPEKMVKLFKDVPQAIENTQKIAAACNVEFQLGKTKLPFFTVPDKTTPEKYLKKLCEQGLKKRYPKKDIQAIERLEYELSIIQKTGFASYFLIVQDFVNWSKENRIVVGPGRGSAAGSLVSYLLNITDVDPIKYDLLFERFLNPERISMPDIDLDFTDWRRDEVINYIRDKYGHDKVAQIITFGTMAARAVIRDVGRALGYSYQYCDQIAKMVPFGFNLDQTIKEVPEFSQLYKMDDQAKRLIDLGKKLEGVVRHASTHACGLVISQDPLTESVPLQHPTQDDGSIVTQYEMHSIEDLGLLKMDLLGLKNLTIIEDTLTRIYKVRNKSLKIEDIPLDDKKTYRLFQEGMTTSVFQLESDGMKRYLKQLKPTKFEDVIAMVALYRPGPMEFLPQYIKGKANPTTIRYIHPELKPILENTYGIMVYQEQLMKIAQKVAGFSLSEADILRKAVGKKIIELLLEQKEKFINGAINKGTSKEVAQRLWEWILPFARYGFNKSHSTCYAMIAYWTAYLKVHYSVEFMAAVLTSEKNDTEKIANLISECKKMKIPVLPPDINESFKYFSVVPDEHKIRFGLLAIKNVGQNVVEAIVKERKANGPYQSITDFIGRVGSKNLNKRSLESLIKTGAFDEFEERNKLLSNMERLLEWSREQQKNKESGQKGLFDSVQTKESPLTLEDAPPASKGEKLIWEKELLGLYISSHPLEEFKTILTKKTLSLNRVALSVSGRTVKVGGIISGIKKVITKKGQPMLFVKLEDYTDKVELVVFPTVTAQNQETFQENKVVIVKGRVDNRSGEPKVICNDIQELIKEV
ncbi:DNA polymerase III subunit alpha [Candidatus Parcubacteria bacterium]|nr:DNA polymerase III subunit alpha [Candidatus Parcubacteria bacterium]